MNMKKKVFVPTQEHFDKLNAIKDLEWIYDINSNSFNCWFKFYLDRHKLEEIDSIFPERYNSIVIPQIYSSRGVNFRILQF